MQGKTLSIGLRAALAIFAATLFVDEHLGDRPRKGAA